MPYFFVAASLVHVIGFIGIFLINIGKLKQDPESMAKVQIRLFIGVGVLEIIPIILVILGMTQIDGFYYLNELIIPISIVVLLTLVAIIIILLQMKVGVPKDAKYPIQMIGMISLGLVVAIPMVSLIGLLTAAM